MAKRRANGEGNLRKRKDGRWEGRYTAGRDPETGRAIYKNVLGKTQAEAKAKLKQAIEEAKGLDTAKVAYIISNFDREISEAIVQRMDRGVTILKGEGAYSGDKKRVLMCAFKQKEIVSLKELIFDVDPNAFIIVCNAHEVTGNGFKTYQKNEI